MRFNFATVAVLALGAQSVAASTWFSKAAYNKWHETELERWLSDHDVPYPTSADRKDLVDLVKTNWDQKIARPYNSWDTKQLQNYISSSGQEIKKGTEQNKDSLVSQVKSYWHETADQASDAYASVQDWVFDSWTESQLKSFLDYHSIPNPSPRSRDTLLHSARSNYQAVAKKAGETTAYPGNWLYSQWSDSDLKAWLDERGIPAPQPTSRDKMIAALRRNARTASNQAAKAAASASTSAVGAQQSLSDQLLNSWSDSQLKQFFDKNGIKVPQGSKRNELMALARKHSAKLSGDNVSASASSVYGEASKSAASVYNAASGAAGKSASSLSGAAAKSASSASGVAGKSASSASVVAGKSASSLSGAAAKSASSATNAAGSQFAYATDAAYGSAQYWFDWAKAQVGIGGEQAKSSLASISSVASASASSLSSVASVSGSSGFHAATDAAAATASSAASVASKSGSSGYYAASDAAGSSASSLSGAAAKSASSASSVASKSASSAASAASVAASKSSSSLSASGPSSASSAASSVASSVSKAGAGYAQQAADAVVENASSAKHRASEAAQRATDRVKEEL
ncbi:hypothetical protein E4T42_05600 [Aureobasidium subglaciale]|uniref:Stress response protein ish1 n=1 Tax=Aureobasidium subglaciale (strain EXF-2481) TaxID=1043005 RepID=A0A074Z3Q3_AURSE|nr:uncharacterized protein AUEXF2481DRAFT_41855 [Aureobasidium subglaciale EXF-2481]KAI5212698.1 hypothetical protein E4T38_00066 [Aureobasidium subglaciale]KAI5232598.1 hypothetical protein E4T40_00066 [Aureobasidium subglaciale]KAI5234918.1 hypothetical protein E4T41_00066 [Aureobasidium subglaciale]KAI5248400.1 hypothetical protein E4T42_05600 [Aureobasidium subglaciale]KAI5268369.1 hypothetical protein E4T46_00066 [Aureobasidium subglaciale]